MLKKTFFIFFIFFTMSSPLISGSMTNGDYKTIEVPSDCRVPLIEIEHVNCPIIYPIRDRFECNITFKNKDKGIKLNQTIVLSVNFYYKRPNEGEWKNYYEPLSKSKYFESIENDSYYYIPEGYEWSDVFKLAGVGDETGNLDYRFYLTCGDGKELTTFNTKGTGLSQIIDPSLNQLIDYLRRDAETQEEMINYFRSESEKNKVTTYLSLSIALLALVFSYLINHSLGIQRIKIEKLFDNRIKISIDLYKNILKTYSPVIKLNKTQKLLNSLRLKTSKTEREKEEKKFTKAVIELTQIEEKQEFYKKLIVNIYDFYLSGGLLLLSEEMRGCIMKLVNPILKNESIYEDITINPSSVKITRAITSYESKIGLKTAIEIFLEIEKRIHEDVELDEMNKILKKKRWSKIILILKKYLKP